MGASRRGFRGLSGVALGLGLLLALGVLAPASAGPQRTLTAQELWRLPVATAELRPFARPPAPWGAGHRGVDLGPLRAGVSIRAPADGEVSFVGLVVDRPVLSIRHGNGYLSSFEPVQSPLEVGDPVAAGDSVGVVAEGSGHCAATCLHWGVRLYGEYINPLLLTGDLEHSVLLPLGAEQIPEWRASEPIE